MNLKTYFFLIIEIDEFIFLQGQVGPVASNVAYLFNNACNYYNHIKV